MGYQVEAARLGNMRVPDLSTANQVRESNGIQSRRLAQNKIKDDLLGFDASEMIESTTRARTYRRRLADANTPVVQRQERLAYGAPASPDQYAFAARIDSSILCSGSLIAPRAVLTAAHCVTDEAGNWESLDFINVKLGAIIDAQDVSVLVSPYCH